MRHSRRVTTFRWMECGNIAVDFQLKATSGHNWERFIEHYTQVFRNDSINIQTIWKMGPLSGGEEEWRETPTCAIEFMKLQISPPPLNYSVHMPEVQIKNSMKDRVM